MAKVKKVVRKPSRMRQAIGSLDELTKELTEMSIRLAATERERDQARDAAGEWEGRCRAAQKKLAEEIRSRSKASDGFRLEVQALYAKEAVLESRIKHARQVLEGRTPGCRDENEDGKLDVYS